MDYCDFIKELSILYGFESYKGIIGNSYAGDVSKTLSEINPMNYKDKPPAMTKNRMTKADALAFMGRTKQ